MPCAGGGPNDYVYMIIPPQTAAMFNAAARVIGRQDLLEDPRFASPQDRVKHGPEMYDILKSWTTTRDKREVMEAFAKEGVPCGAVFDTMEILELPQLIKRGVVTEVEHRGRGRHKIIGSPVRLSDSSVEVTHPPLYGEHSDEVLTTLGGMTQEEIDKLRQEKAII